MRRPARLQSCPSGQSRLRLDWPRQSSAALQVAIRRRCQGSRDHRDLHQGVETAERLVHGDMLLRLVGCEIGQHQIGRSRHDFLLRREADFGGSAAAQLAVLVETQAQRRDGAAEVGDLLR